jgi:hypothetical protein
MRDQPLRRRGTRPRITLIADASTTGHREVTGSWHIPESPDSGWVRPGPDFGRTWPHSGTGNEQSLPYWPVRDERTRPYSEAASLAWDRRAGRDGDPRGSFVVDPKSWHGKSDSDTAYGSPLWSPGDRDGTHQQEVSSYTGTRPLGNWRWQEWDTLASDADQDDAGMIFGAGGHRRPGGRRWRAGRHATRSPRWTISVTRNLTVVVAGLALIALTNFFVRQLSVVDRAADGTSRTAGSRPARSDSHPSPRMSGATPRPGASRGATLLPGNQSSTPPSSASPSGLEAAYSEAARSGGGFTGQVTIVNDTVAPVSDWLLVIALPHDNFTTVTRGRAVANDGLISISPASSDASIASGSTLVVSFSASGPTTTPQLCSFNTTTCT